MNNARSRTNWLSIINYSRSHAESTLKNQNTRLYNDITKITHSHHIHSTQYVSSTVIYVIREMKIPQQLQYERFNG